MLPVYSTIIPQKLVLCQYSTLLLTYIIICVIIMLTMGNKEFAEWLTKKVEEAGWSYRELGRRSNLSSGAISKVITGNASPGWDFCVQIAQAFNESPIKVFRLTGLLPAVEEMEEALEEFQRLLSKLPEKERKEAIERITSMLKWEIEQSSKNKSDNPGRIQKIA